MSIVMFMVVMVSILVTYGLGVITGTLCGRIKELEEFDVRKMDMIETSEEADSADQWKYN
ncbi:hypothetical protein M0R72_14245 [Candidatus Pacearchaeota archaeon]|nr:hypothetical protein [Candidatus Pacearchaeota archaeon]